MDEHLMTAELEEAEDSDDSLIVSYKETFSYFDKNGNGCITTRELPALLRSLGKEYSSETLDECLASCNLPGNGDIPFAEFLKIMKK